MKLNLIYYKNILDLAMIKFFDAYGDKFTKQNDKYVFSMPISKKQLEDIFENLIGDEIKHICNTINLSNEKYVLIGSCYPKNNFLLTIKDDSYIPKKIISTIECKPNIKWLLKEDDISIDIECINEVFINIFNSMFKNERAFRRIVGDIFSNIIVVSHSYLDCYMMFKIIKWAYGRTNCTNIWKDKIEDRREVLMSLNDELAKYIKNKTALNTNFKFKKYAHEVKDYLDMKLKIN